MPLEPNSWQEKVKSEQPDIFITQSTLCFHNNDWGSEFMTDNGSGIILKRILSYCKKNDIPTVFWDTEERTHLPFFKKTASDFDYIFVADKHNFKTYQEFNGCERVLPLNISIQPALHNIIQHDKFILKNKGFSILFDGWADILEWPHKYSFLKKLFKDGLHIVESRYRFMANKLEDLPDFREHIMGHLTYGQFLSALKAYKVVLISENSLSSSLSLAKKAIEAAACGASVIYMGSKNEFIPDNVVTYANSDKDAVSLCKKLLKQGINTEINRLANIRLLYSNHTYSHRLQTICSKLGIEHSWKEFPLVSIITPTKRPENFEKAFKSYKNQKYPHKEWIVILNSSQNIPADIKRKCEQNPDIRLLQLHEEKNIGICLNVGIEKAVGDYWFKMDDDDLYGPNYILDMMFEVRSIDADIFGKPRGFILFKKTNKLILRSEALTSQNIYSKGKNVSHICGATISGKMNIFPRIKFSEERRANVDSDFVRQCIDDPVTSVYLSNVYGFVTVREKDNSKHTWSADETLFKRASYLNNKKDILKVMS
jgi:cellulose synthase/poly-beta-1,6-N-acetylglucosamine synthase-like glycosyltransferase